MTLVLPPGAAVASTALHSATNIARHRRSWALRIRELPLADAAAGNRASQTGQEPVAGLDAPEEERCGPLREAVRALRVRQREARGGLRGL